MAKSKSQDLVFTMRLDADTARRIKRIQEGYFENTPRFTRAAVVRWLLELGMDSLASESKSWDGSGARAGGGA